MRLFLLPSTLALLFPLASFATVTVTSGDARPLISDGTKSYAYFGVITAETNLDGVAVDTNAGFNQLLDLRTYPASAPYTSYIYYTIASSTATLGTGNRLLMSVKVTGSTDKIPISLVNGTECSTTAGTCQDPVTATVNGVQTTLFRGVRYTPGTTITIGLSPYLICAVNTTAQGCLSGSFVSPVLWGGSSSAITQMEFTVEFASAADDTAGATGTASDTGYFNARYQVDDPTFVCPGGGTNPTQLFYPGDGQIYVDFSQFSIVSSGSTSFGTNRAPLNAVIAVAKKGGSGTAVVDPATFQTANDFEPYRSTQLSANELVGGFQNSTPTSLIDYNVSFIARDATGMLAVPGGNTTPDSTACQLVAVRTADVQGFLARGKCFIASAAFRDTDAAPVEMLREFRSKILMHSSLGRAFVRTYYSWSHEPATWLLEHPVFRGPVLLALLPVQWFAWMLLNPSLALGGCGLIFALMIALKRWRVSE